MSELEIPTIVRSIQQGICWLKDSADKLNDTRDIAITLSAMVAAEKNPHSHLVQRLAASLINRQAGNGSWNDEVWDTAWAIQALSDAGHPITHRSISSALGFLEATQDPFTGTWYEEPFETLSVLQLLARVAPEQLAVSCDRAIRWVASLQKPDGTVIGIRYTGMAASLFFWLAKQGLSVQETVLPNALEHIRRDLVVKPIWSSASWSNYYPLKALIEAGAAVDDPAVVRGVSWFLDSQDADGKWMQVSRVHDTAMAVLVLSSLLTTPLVNVADPRTGILNVLRENGTIRISFHGPGAGAIAPAEKLKISDHVREELSRNQQLIVTALGKIRSRGVSIAAPRPTETSAEVELEKAGKYAFGHLIPSRIQLLLGVSPADHLRLDLDERLIDLPWEVIHDGSEFLCLKYAVGRRLMSDQTFEPPRHYAHRAADTRVLIVADPTRDLPAARKEGYEVASLLRDKCGMTVDEFIETPLTKKDFLLSLKDYDLVHYAGHASHESSSPDESCLVFPDGDIQAFEIARFLANRSPAVVFLNACWSAEELRDPNMYSPMMRGLGRTFLYAGVSAFLGYLVPVPDESATRFAISFYASLAQGQTIGESARQARLGCRQHFLGNDLTWSSAILYGDPAVRAIEVGSNN